MPLIAISVKKQLLGIYSTVNASLKWASIVGMLVLVYGLAATPLAFAQIFCMLQRRADTSPAIIAKTLIIFFQGLGRLIGLPTVGLIIFFPRL